MYSKLLSRKTLCSKGQSILLGFRGGYTIYMGNLQSPDSLCTWETWCMHYKVVPGFFFLSFPSYLSCSQRHTEIISGQAGRSSQRDPCLRRNLWSPITSQHSVLWNSLHLGLSVWLPLFFFGGGGAHMADEGVNWAAWARWSLQWQSSQMCTQDLSQGRWRHGALETEQSSLAARPICS